MLTQPIHLSVFDTRHIVSNTMKATNPIVQSDSLKTNEFLYCISTKIEFLTGIKIIGHFVLTTDNGNCCINIKVM